MTIFISHDNCYTFNRFFKDCGQSLRKEAKFIFYADLAHRKNLPNDLALFTDLERLNEAQIELAIAAENSLREAGVRIINPPSQVLRRYDLLQKFFRDGTNEFRAYRLHEERTHFRYPVFLRLEREHQGSLSALLNTPAEVETAIQAAFERGLPKDNLLLVEYCDVCDADGLFRKYSAFMIGERCFPRHIIAGRKWLSKSPDKAYENDKECLRHENAYLTEFPHEKEVRELFHGAAIDYGRIDYSLKNGRVQVWEINTNPNIIPEATLAQGRRSGQEQVHRNVVEALQALQPTARSSPGKIPFQVPAEVKSKLQISSIDSLLHPLHRQLRPVRPERVKRFIKKRLLKR